MNIEQFIYSKLSTDPTISGLVSTRITPLIRQQGQTLPAITYQQIDNIIDHHLQGSSGWCEARYQINCFDDDYDDMIVLAKAVRELLDGYSDSNIDHIFLNDEGETEPTDSESEDFIIYVKRMDFVFYYND